MKCIIVLVFHVVAIFGQCNQSTLALKNTDSLLSEKTLCQNGTIVLESQTYTGAGWCIGSISNAAIVLSTSPTPVLWVCAGGSIVIQRWNVQFKNIRFSGVIVRGGNTNPFLTSLILDNSIAVSSQFLSFSQFQIVGTVFQDSLLSFDNNVSGVCSNSTFIRSSVNITTAVNVVFQHIQIREASKYTSFDRVSLASKIFMSDIICDRAGALFSFSSVSSKSVGELYNVPPQVALSNIRVTNSQDSTLPLIAAHGINIDIRNILGLNMTSINTSEPFMIVRSSVVALTDMWLGGGNEVLSSAGSRVTILRCVFSENKGGVTLDGGDVAIGSAAFQRNTARVAPLVISNCATVSVLGCLFEANSGGSGAMLVRDSVQELRILQTVFKNNMATSHGGAAYIDSADSLIEECIFRNNRANITGGALFLRRKVSISRTLFQYNIAVTGGAIQTSSDLNMNFVVFTGNQADLGGAVYSADDSNGCETNYPQFHTYITDCVFERNSGPNPFAKKNSDAGALNIKNKGFITRCIFLGNFVSLRGGDGGSIYSQGSVFIKACFFIDGYGNDKGGYLYCKAGQACNVSDSHFESSSSYLGGAIYGDPGVNVTNCTFLKTTSDLHGGAVYSLGGILESSSFQDCLSKNGDGGAAALFGSESTVHRVVIDNCTVLSSSATGGAISADFLLHLTDSVLTNSRAGFGGGFYSRGGRVSTSYLKGNRALSFGGGAYNDYNLTLIDTLFINNSALVGGGLVSYESLVVSRCVFSGNNGSSLGGAIHMAHGNLTMSDSLIQGGTSNSGGAVHSLKSMDIRNVTFRQNSAPAGTAGAIFSVDKLYLENCNFVNCTSTVGGAVNSDGPTIEIIGGYFARNGLPTTLKGGAIHTTSARMAWTRTLFIDNQANEGGAVYSGQPVNALTVSFIRNIGGSAGGALSSTLSEQDTTTLNGRTTLNETLFFMNQVKRGPGGAIQIVGTIYVRDSLFKQNTASAEGGAIELKSNANSKNAIWGSQFERNSGKRGGAVYGSSITLDISRSVFNSNNASDSGGVMYVDSGGVSIDNSLCVSNKAGVNGGSVWFQSISEKSPIKISLSHFHGNAATKLGGAIYSTSTYMTLSGSSLTSNSAIHGAAVYVLSSDSQQSSRVLLSDSTFLSNNGSLGSGLYCDGLRVILKRCIFQFHVMAPPKDNSLYQLKDRLFVGKEAKQRAAGVSAGCIFLKNSSLNLEDSRFSVNKADVGSCVAMVLSNSSDVTITNCSMKDNSAVMFGGAMYFGFAEDTKPSRPRITIEPNNIVSNNTAQIGGGLYAAGNISSNNEISRAAFQNNNSTIYGSNFASYPAKLIANVHRESTQDGIAAANYGRIMAINNSFCDLCSPDDRVLTSTILTEVPVGLPFTVSGYLMDSFSNRVRFSNGTKQDDLLTAKLISRLANSSYTKSYVRVQAVFDPSGVVIIPQVLYVGPLGPSQQSMVEVDDSYDVEPGYISFSAISCPPGYELKAKGDNQTALYSCDQCAQRTFNAVGGVALCEPCQDDKVTCTATKVLSRKGYYISVEDSHVYIYKCPVVSLCLGDNVCASNHDIESPACGRCLPGFKVNGKECVKCENMGVQWFLFILFQLMIYLFTFFLYKSTQSTPEVSSSVFRILVYFVQIVQLASSSSYDEFYSILSFFYGTDSVLNSGCIGNEHFPFHKPNFSVVIMLLTLWIQYIIHMRITSNADVENRERLKRKYTNTVSGIVFISVFNTSLTFAKYFTCVQVGTNIKVVISQPAIVCYSASWKLNAIVLTIAFIIIWGAFVIHTVKVYVLYKVPENRQHLRTEWPALFDKYKRPNAKSKSTTKLRLTMCEWWLFILVGRRISYIGGYVITFLSINDPSVESIQPRLVVGFLATLHLLVHSVISPYVMPLDNFLDGLTQTALIGIVIAGVGKWPYVEYAIFGIIASLLVLVSICNWLMRFEKAAKVLGRFGAREIFQLNKNYRHSVYQPVHSPAFDDKEALWLGDETNGSHRLLFSEESVSETPGTRRASQTSILNVGIAGPSAAPIPQTATTILAEEKNSQSGTQVHPKGKKRFTRNLTENFPYSDIHSESTLSEYAPSEGSMQHYMAMAVPIIAEYTTDEEIIDRPVYDTYVRIDDDSVLSFGQLSKTTSGNFHITNNVLGNSPYPMPSDASAANVYGGMLKKESPQPIVPQEPRRSIYDDLFLRQSIETDTQPGPPTSNSNLVRAVSNESRTVTPHVNVSRTPDVSTSGSFSINRSVTGRHGGSIRGSQPPEEVPVERVEEHMTSTLALHGTESSRSDVGEVDESPYRAVERGVARPADRALQSREQVLYLDFTGVAGSTDEDWYPKSNPAHDTRLHIDEDPTVDESVAEVYSQAETVRCDD